MIKSYALVMGALATAAGAFGQVSYSGGTYNELFDSLSSAAMTGHFVNPAGTPAAIPGLTTWRGARIAGTGTAMNYTIDTGGANSGAIYNYGQPDAAATDRALGSLASGSNAGAFGFQLVNNGSDAIDSFTLMFDGEQYRSSTTSQNTLTFAYAVSGGSVDATNFLISGAMIGDVNGNIVGQAAAATAVQLTPPADLGPYMVTVTSLNVPVGGSIFFRWQDFDNVGSDAGLAIDDLKFTATFVPAPGSAVLLAGGGLLLARRRR